VEILSITQDDSKRLKDILEVFDHARGRTIQEGHLRIDNVLLAL